jgi:hypothetical protein
MVYVTRSKLSVLTSLATSTETRSTIARSRVSIPPLRNGVNVKPTGGRRERERERCEVHNSLIHRETTEAQLNDNELDAHISTIEQSPIVGKCVRFLVEVGEPGLVREIVKYVDCSVS